MLFIFILLLGTDYRVFKKSERWTNAYLIVFNTFTLNEIHPNFKSNTHKNLIKLHNATLDFMSSFVFEFDNVFFTVFKKSTSHEIHQHFLSIKHQNVKVNGRSLVLKFYNIFVTVSKKSTLNEISLVL